MGNITIISSISAYEIVKKVKCKKPVYSPAIMRPEACTLNSKREKKMYKKKLLAGLLVGILAFGTSGCGGDGQDKQGSEQNSSDGGKVKLTGMVWGNTESHEKMTEELFKANPELADKYEVEWIIGGEGDANVAEKIRLALSANEAAADFVQLNYTQVAEFAEAECLEDVSASIEKYQGDLLDAAVTLSQYKDQTIAFPFELKPRLWFYRSDIFEEAQVDAAQIKDVDSLIEAGKKIQAIYPDSYIWNIGPDATAYNYFLTLSGNGARFNDEEGNYTVASDPGVKSMLEDYKKLVDSGVVMNVSDWTKDWENALNDGTLVSQLSAAWLSQDSFLPTYASGQEGKWKAAVWPELGGADGGSDAGGSVFVIPAFSSAPKEAAEFLEALTLSEEGRIAIYNNVFAIPVNRKALESDAVNTPNAFLGDSLLSAQEQALEQYKIFDYSPKAAQETTIAIEYFTKAVYGDMSIEEAMEAAQEDMENIIGNAYQ